MRERERESHPSAPLISYHPATGIFSSTVPGVRSPSLYGQTLVPSATAYWETWNLARKAVGG